MTPMPPWSCTHSWMISVRALADIGLGRAGELGGIGGALLHGPGGMGGDAVGRFEPQLHIGEPVFERLVRAERTAERVAVAGVLGGHGEHTVDGAVGLVALQHHRGLRTSRSISAAAPSISPTTDVAGTTTSAKVMWLKRRTRSRVVIGVTLTPACRRDEQVGEARSGTCRHEEVIGDVAGLDGATWCR